MSKVHSRHGQYSDARLLLVFVVAFTIRLILQFTSLPEVLYDRVEISTPVTSYKRLQEGLYLYEHGIDPYDGGICHQAPILLAMLASLKSLPFSHVAVSVLYASVDILVCMFILDIASTHVSSNRGSTPTRSIPPWVLASIALLNPLSILTAIARSSASFTSLAIVGAISHSLKGQLPAAMFLLAIATYLSVYPVLLIAPISMIISQRTKSRLLTTSVATTIMLSIMLAACLYSSHFWLGSWHFVWSNYSILLFMTDLTPNIGLWWYFFTEMFEDFRNFFLGVFQLHLLIYVVPLCIKLRKSPLFVCVTLCGLAAIFKPYPSIADTGLYLSLLPVFPHLFDHTRYLFLVACALIYCCIFGPAFYFLWIYAGSGNANFFYAITLVWNLTQGILLTDTVFANLKDQWEAEEPAARQGRQLEVVQLAD